MKQPDYFFDADKDPMDELLQKKPSWVILNSTMICMLVFSVLAGVLSVIKYRIEVRQPVTISRVENAGARHYEAVVHLKQSLLPTIRKGQPIEITLEALPEEKYGRIKGVVSHIPDSVSPDQSVHVQVALQQNSLYQELLKQGLEGSGVVDVRQKSLFRLLFGN